MLHYSMFSRALLVTVLCAAISIAAAAETVTVKYRGPVPLDTSNVPPLTVAASWSGFAMTRSSQYMVILLKGTYYHYCEIGQGTVDALVGAESMGKYFNANIRGSSMDGPFDCRTHRVPAY